MEYVRKTEDSLRKPPRYSIADLLDDMVEKGASDLYLCAGTKPRFAIEGSLEDAREDELRDHETESYARLLMTEEEYHDFEEEFEANVSYSTEKGHRFRVNIYIQRSSKALVIRQIKTEVPTIEGLGLPGVLKNLMSNERGMVLVTGATGAGKSTTVAAMINHRNQSEGGHIITIEDPIEFVHPHINSIVSQREVGIDTKSFHAALKNSLRQAPKVIYIGEIRDTETMGFAIHASETGHLVLGTLHSTNANQTLERIINFFPRNFQDQVLLQLSLNIKAIVSQRLLKQKEGGRTAAFEIMLDTPMIRELIKKGDIKQIKKTMLQSTHEKMQTFDQHLHLLWKNGLISEEEAFRHADSSNNLRLAMNGVGMAM